MGEVGVQDLAAWLLEQVAWTEQGARERLEDVAQYSQAEIDPDYVLAECAAKRRIIELHASEDIDGRLPDGEEITLPVCVVCRDSNDMREEVPCPTLRLLALPYRGRPGYLDSWDPDGR